MTMETVSVHRKLPVWAVIKRSYGYVWDHRGLLALPLIVIAIVQFGTAFYLQTIQAAAMSDRLSHGPIGQIYAISLATTIFSMSVIVGIHRTVLLGETRSGFRFLRWDANLLRYFGTWLMLALVAFLLALIAIVAGIIITLVVKLSREAHVAIIVGLVGIVIIGSFFRFMLALPSAAVGDRDRLGVSWKATRGNWLRLVAVVFLTALPFILIQMVAFIPQIDEMRNAMHGHVGEMHRSPIAILILGSIIRAIDLAVLTVMLSLSYDALVRGGGPAVSEPA